jgi:hypothetical protein
MTKLGRSALIRASPTLLFRGSLPDFLGSSTARIVKRIRSGPVWTGEKFVVARGSRHYD